MRSPSTTCSTRGRPAAPLDRTQGCITFVGRTPAVSTPSSGVKLAIIGESEGGIVDAVSVLTQEHQKAKELFERIEASSDPATRQSLLTEVITALRSHTKIEEEILYPVVRDQMKGGSKLF